MDNTVPPFDSKLVRQAFQAVLNREAFNQNVLLGLGVPAYDHPVWPGDPHFYPGIALPLSDPVLARSLLAEAGYPEGIDVTLYAKGSWRGVDFIDLAVAFRRGAEHAGIRVDIDPGVTYWPVFRDDAFEVVPGLSWPNAELAVSHGYLRDTPSLWKPHHKYGNPAVDAGIRRARGEGQEQRKATYRWIQQTLNQDVPQLVIAFLPKIFGAGPDVRDLELHPVRDAVVFRDVWLER